MQKKILYLTLSEINLTEEGIYSDLINELTALGHEVTVVVADHAGHISATGLSTEHGIRVLRVLVGELFRVNFIKKGINTLKVEPCFKKAIKQHLGTERFDMVLYATPPVTFASVVAYCKKHLGCCSYLMLKDIFPQNAVDIGLFSNGGLLHRFFQQKERKLYALSDTIGCMSQGNIEYLRTHEPELVQGKIESFPNTVSIAKLDKALQDSLGVSATEIRERYQIPSDRTVFVFGGNLGKPQAIDYLIDAIKQLESYTKAYFLFVGNGSEKSKAQEAAKKYENIGFIDFIPVDEYHTLMQACDVGIISLDVRFTIPNYPSRTLSYMAMSKPILACTDRVTDIRRLVETEAECGLWNASDDVDGFAGRVRVLCEDEALRTQYGKNGRMYLEENFDVSRSVELLESHLI